MKSYENVNEHEKIRGKIRLFASLLPTDRIYTKLIER